MKIIVLENGNAEIILRDRKILSNERMIEISHQYPLVVLEEFITEGKNSQVINSELTTSETILKPIKKNKRGK